MRENDNLIKAQEELFESTKMWIAFPTSCQTSTGLPSSDAKHGMGWEIESGCTAGSAKRSLSRRSQRIASNGLMRMRLHVWGKSRETRQHLLGVWDLLAVMILLGVGSGVWGKTTAVLPAC